jgi:hypothetical protein
MRNKQRSQNPLALISAVCKVLRSDEENISPGLASFRTVPNYWPTFSNKYKARLRPIRFISTLNQAISK